MEKAALRQMWRHDMQNFVVCAVKQWSGPAKLVKMDIMQSSFSCAHFISAVGDTSGNGQAVCVEVPDGTEMWFAPSFGSWRRAREPA